MKRHQMFRKLASFAIAASVVFFANPSWASLTLDDFYRAALVQSETLASQTERIEQAQEKIRQAYGALMPNVNFIGNFQKQQEVSQDGVSSRFSPSFQPSMRFNLVQPLFRGLREFAALNQTKMNRAITDAERANAEMLLFQDVSNQYYAIVALEKNLATLEEGKSVYDKRIDELQSRVRIGKSRRSELFSVQAAQAKTHAEIKRVQGQIGASHEALRFLTGLVIPAGLASSSSVHARKPALEEFLDKIEARPDVDAAKSRVEFSESAVSLAKGEHAPSADLSANYWVRRLGILSEVKWDAAVTVTFPIFQGGIVSSRVREAASVRRQSEIALTQVRRQAERDIRSLYATLAAEYDRLSELDRASALAQKNYEEQNREYRFGLVNNIDVLTSLESLYDSKLELDRSKVEIERLISQLKAATRSAGEQLHQKETSS